MAIVYNLFTDTELEPTSLYQDIASFLEKKWDKNKDQFVDFSAIPVSDYYKESIKQNFSFDARGEILARLDKFAEDDFATLQMLDAFSEVLKKGVENALMLFDGEIPVFYYHEKRAFLNSARKFWTESRIQRLNLPFEWKALPLLE